MEGLTKLFKNRKQTTLAVDRLTFEVKQGEIVGLLGPNGAGKTTAIRLLSTLVTPTSGDASINGASILDAPERVRASLGVSLGDERSFYYRLSGYQNLEFFGTLQNVPARKLLGHIIGLMEKVGLMEAKDKKFMKYSSGMKRKLNLCRAMLADPPVYFFDEPTTSLDPPTAAAVREMILELKRDGKTILLTTQNMQEAEGLCDRIVMINKGRLIVTSTADELKRTLGAWIVQLTISERNTLPLEHLRTKPFVRRISVNDRVCTIITTDKLQLLHSLFTQTNGTLEILEEIKIIEPSLEEVFLRYVRGNDG